MSAIEKGLLTIAALITLSIIIITAVALTTHPERVGSAYRKIDPTPQKVVNRSKNTTEAIDAYTQLGQLRIMTQPNENQERGSVLVVKPWFSYPQGDIPLFEELTQKERQIQNIITAYLSQQSKDELIKKGETAIKDDLVNLINAQLVMGKIRALYFDDYIFFD